jgi:hypothetical protein
MKPEEIAAYVGAAAWLPQIAVWLYRSLVRPKLRIVPEQRAEIGFTTYGPIFNVRMAFFVEHRDLIIDGIDLTIRHETGERRAFRWIGIGETFSQVTDAEGRPQQTVSRDQTPIAIKISTQSLFEKKVRFQEPRFHQADSELVKALIEHFNFLKQKDQASFVAETLASKQFFDVIEARHAWFWWKPGSYDVELTLSSPQSFRLMTSRFAFDLAAIEIDHLKKNLPIIDAELRNTVNSNLPDFKAEPIAWLWSNPPLRRA